MNRGQRRRAQKLAVKAAKVNPELIHRLVALYWDPKQYRWHFDDRGLTIVDKITGQRRYYPGV